MPNISHITMSSRVLAKIALTVLVTSAVGHVALAQQESSPSSIVGSWMLVSEVAHQGGLFHYQWR